MPQTSQAQLREELSKALKDAKSMFDDGLVDEKEYGDLKQHELAKYKAAVATLAAAPPAPATPPPPPPPPQLQQLQQLQQLPSLPPPPRPAPPPAPARAAVRGHSPAVTPERARVSNRAQVVVAPQQTGSVAVDPDMYERLRTPPIFRRRSAAARRTVVLSGSDADALQPSLPFE